MILCQAQFFFYQEDGGRVPNLIHWDALIDPHGQLVYGFFHLVKIRYGHLVGKVSG